MRRRLGSLAIGLSLAAIAAPPATAADLRTGFVDDGVLTDEPALRADWLSRVTRQGASMVRISLFWSATAPSAPPADRAGDPAWPGYRFDAVDAQVKAARDAGLTVVLNLSTAPRWAEGTGKTTRNQEGIGSWMPDPRAFAAFSSAVAKRYSGAFPDPAAPDTALPPVSTFQIWNEPNLNIYLAPQFDPQGRPFAAVRFRDLVNGAYDAIKAVDPRATVVAGGLAPYGDPGTKGYRSRPVAFLRSMLCLGNDLKPACNVRTRVDAISLHPYAVDRPSRSARNGDDATIPDVKRLTTVTKAAAAAKLVGPRRPATWVTEVSYDSSPPDPDGVPTATRARYIAQTQQLLFEQGVRTILWSLLRDQLPQPSFAATYQSGMYTADGREKADAVAFRFPVVVTSRSRTRLTVWWRSPVTGAARVQALRGGRWRTEARTAVRATAVRTTSVLRRDTTAVRVRVSGGVVSYTANVR